MVLENKLGIKNPVELAILEEKLSKKGALAIFKMGLEPFLPVGSFASLVAIHKALFSEIYDFAGQVRQVNISKGNFRFAPLMYLESAIASVEAMPQDSFEAIVSKYVEMNVVHPFREGNGRSMRIWLDMICKQELQQVIDWSQIDKESYLLAMERSPIKDTEIKELLRAALSSDIDNRQLFMKGLDASYAYEGYQQYESSLLGKE